MLYIFYNKEKDPANYGCNTLAEVYANVPRIKEICQTEENIHVSMNHCDGTKARKWGYSEYLYFDLDYDPNLDKWLDYLSIVAKITNIPQENWWVNFSGRGLHFITQIKKIITEQEFHLLQNKYRKAIANLNDEMVIKDLPGKFDMIFDKARTLRVPGTTNEKNRIQSYILQKSNGAISSQPLSEFVRKEKSPDFSEPSSSHQLKGSKMELIDPNQTNDIVQEQSIAFHGTPDTQAILKGCEFLKHCATNPADISEPEWYAMVSITARLERGEELTHSISEGHPDYSQRGTQAKINQSLRSAGPRTCKNIESLWNGCKQCPFYNKVASPISIKSAQHIATLNTGFHYLIEKENGGVKHVPAIEDMVRFIVQTKNIKIIQSNGQMFEYINGRYHETNEQMIKAFARKHFVPAVKTKETQEVFKIITETQELFIKHQFNDYPYKLNVRNGIVDLLTKELHPHSPDYLFTAQTDIEFDPNATAQAFVDWIKFIFYEDQDKINTTLDYCAYAMCGTNISAEKLILFTGSGANGKSVLIKIMKMLLGDYCAFTKAHTFSTYGKHILIGSRAVVFEELPAAAEKAFWEEMKDLSSGGIARIEQKYLRDIEVASRSKFFFTSNELPYGSESNNGFFRRFLIIKFERQFSDEEKINNFEDKFVNELPGILNLLIERLKPLKADNFKIVGKGSVAQEIEEYKLEKDLIAQYIADQLTKEDDPTKYPKYAINSLDGHGKKIELIKLFHESYLKWCDYRRTKAMSNTMFTKRIKGHLKDNVLTKGHKNYLFGYVPGPVEESQEFKGKF